jgi:hypothetical protein
MPSDTAQPATSFLDRLAAAVPPRQRVRDKLGSVEVDLVALTGGERNRIIDRAKAPGGGKGIVLARYQVDLVIAGVYRPDTDERVFTAKNEELINRFPAEEIDRVCKVIEKLSGLDKKAEERAEGNSEEGDV